MTTWFTSDLHFFHRNVIVYCARPFATVEEMNGVLVENWNRVVSPDDDVYCLGDLSLAFRPIELFSSRLVGQKFLVPGNHDLCHTYNKKSRSPDGAANWKAKYEEHGWAVLPEQTTLDIPGIGIVDLCHMPYADVDQRDGDERGQDKYERWRPRDRGRWLLCGHVHEKWKQKGRMINVGVDVWGMSPVNIETIKALLTPQ